MAAAADQTPAAVFSECCAARRVKKPSKALAQLFGGYRSTADIVDVDLAGMYLGARQMLAVVDFVGRCRSIKSFSVRGQCCYAADLGGIWHGTKSGEVPTGNEVWTHVLDMARTHPTLAHLDLSDNDCGPLVGRQLEAAVKDNKHLVRVTHDNVLIDADMLAAIDAQVAQNAGAAPPAKGRAVGFAQEEPPAPPTAAAVESPDDSGFGVFGGGDDDGGFGGGFVTFDTGNSISLDTAADSPPNQMKKIAARRQSKSCAPITKEDIEAFVPPVHPKEEATASFLATLLQQNLLFSHLQSHELKVVVDSLFEKSYTADEVVMTEGDEGHDMYTIERGTVDILIDGRKVAQKKEGVSFGELALMYGCPRSATVKAATNVRAWGIDRDTYRNIVMGASIRKRNEYSTVLANIPFLQSLTDYERMQLSDALESQEWGDGDAILRYNQNGEHMYIVLGGEVVVMGRDKAGESIEVCRFGPGRHFGELEFINNHAVVADVTAVGGTRTARINRQHFELCLGPLIDMMKRNVGTEEYAYYRNTISNRDLSSLRSS